MRAAVGGWSFSLDRPLPWRGERDPWCVLCSEVMLQQTQATRVAEIYPRFMRRFPTVSAMARADAADVLRAWENLGYNRRALNLWRSARLIVERGEIPSTIDELEGLPGIGPYTARAVASFAFGVDVAAVDANVRRVIVRVCGDDADVQAVADALVPPGKSAGWNQAMIDLGAVVCTARRPRCGGCPLRSLCSWQDSARAPVARRGSQRFESTSRYARGRVVDALRSGPMTMAKLLASLDLDAGRLDGAIASLERDDLAHRRGRMIALGPRPAR